MSAPGLASTRPPIDGRPGDFHHRSRGGFGGFGFGPALIGPDFGFTTYGGTPTSDEAPDDGYGPQPLVIPAPSCVPPQIIRIGRGPTTTPKTRVVYGPARCDVE